MKFLNKNRVFLDYASATPLLSEVKKEMDKYASVLFYNPSAIYEEGVEVKGVLSELRHKVAELLKVSSHNIVFTSGGTESDNLAILGVYEKWRGKISAPHMIISSMEHPGVLEAAAEVERRGGRASFVSPDEKGIIRKEEVEKLLTRDTVLVSVGLVNSELGIIEPVNKIGRLVRQYRKQNNTPYPFLHSDASQAVFENINVEGMNIDLLSLDGGKIYGPKGSGILVVRPPATLHPIIFGGGQERGLRSGTENASLIAGFTKALEINFKNKEKENLRLAELKDQFVDEIEEIFPEAIVQGKEVETAAHIVAVSFREKMAEFLAIQLDLEGICVSTGSACGTGKNEPGMNALRAMNQKDLEEATLRFSFGRETRKSDITQAIKALQKIMQGV